MLQNMLFAFMMLRRISQNDRIVNYVDTAVLFIKKKR